MESFMENMNCLLLGIAFILVYFIPFNIANSKNHPQKVAIFVLNFFAGWTFIGWLVALVWAVANPGQTEENTIPFDIADELQKLADLKEKGILTEEEFNAQKSQLLNP